MTAIIALRSGDKVYIGGDCMGSNGHTKGMISDSKVHPLDEDFVVGYAGSFRFGQVLTYSFAPPPRTETQLDMEYLINSFVPELKACTQSLMESDDIVCALFLYRGNIYELQSDWSILAWDKPVVAIGSGADVIETYAEALLEFGYIEEEKGNRTVKTKLTPEQIIAGALAYTSEKITTVGGIGPIYYQECEEEE